MLVLCHGMWVGVVGCHKQTTSSYRKCKYRKSRTVTRKDGVKDIWKMVSKVIDKMSPFYMVFEAKSGR